jgi:ubiquinone/menaquinone biosynthesis C-methylase UbiE
MEETIESLAPWFYEFDLGPLGSTASTLPAEVQPIHDTRLQMLNQAIDRIFTPDELRESDCLDVGCHEGYYAVALAKRGARRILGLDVRGENLRRATFVANALGLSEIEFRQGNAEHISRQTTGTYDLTLFFGILYHLENPMLCLRNVAGVTKRACIVETQVIDEVTGETEWGSRLTKYPYLGALALIDETVEFERANREAGATPLVTCPTPKALVTMLLHAGFPRVEFIAPPPGAYEQFARGKRVMCVAFKE